MKGHSIHYSDEEMAWLHDNRAMVISEYSAAFCDHFNHDIAAANLHALRKRKGWKTGRTGCFPVGHKPHNKGMPHPAARNPASARHQFKKGGLPHNTKYAGHERVSKDGYVEVSVEQANPHTGFSRRYVLKHRWLWEQQNGPVPKGMCLKSLDGDKLNTDPSNWALVPRALLPRLNGKRGRGYDEAPAELKPMILAVARLEHEAREALKGQPA